MARNSDLAQLQSGLDHAILCGYGLGIAHLLYRVQALLSDKSTSRAEKSHLRAMRRRAKEFAPLAVAAVDKIRKRLMDNLQVAARLFASTPLGWAQADRISSRLDNANVHVRTMGEPACKIFLTSLLGNVEMPTSFLQRVESEIATLQRRLKETTAALPPREEVGQQQRRQAEANRHKRQEQNRQRSASHPKGKGKKGKRHLPNKPL